MLAVAVTLATVGAIASPVSAAPVGVDPDGRWGPVESWPLVAIHSALTPDGDVVTFGTNGVGQQGASFIYDVWDSTGDAGVGHTTLPNTTSTDIFCSIQVVRPDTGNLVMFGGDNIGPDDRTLNTGNPDINVYDPGTGSLSTVGVMQRNRWYATATTLPDGSVYIQGGYDDPDGFYGNDIAEHWSEGTGAQALPFPTDHLTYFYPRNFVAPDGRIFGFDVNGRMYFVSQDLQTMTAVGQLAVPNRGHGSSAVMFEPGRILQFGGKSKQAVIIDITSGSPVITPTGDLFRRRDWVNGTLLPDGRVLATGGSTQPNLLVNVSYSAEIWDPATGVWTTAADEVVHRLYHSTALLLPDGRVLVAGGGSPGPTNELNAEIYSPDYLVAADGSDMPRPAITAVSSGPFRPGENVTVSVDDATDIDRVTLVKTGSVTHSFNVDQRFVEPTWSAAGNDLTVTLPANAADLTPGYYLVTVLDTSGIPSPSEIIQVMPPRPEILGGVAQVTEGDAGSSTLVSVPITLSTSSLEPVTVDWTTTDVPGDPAFASSVEGDYVASSGTATFAPGDTTQSLDVTVLGDDLDEGAGESILVTLSNPTNATIGGSGQATGTIDDDDDPPELVPGYVLLDEGDSGSIIAHLPATLSAPSSREITVEFETITYAGPGLATVGVDHQATSGTATFAPGETEQLVPITVFGDTDVEPDLLWGEWALVRFFDAVDATVNTSFFGLGLVIIRNDD